MSAPSFDGAVRDAIALLRTLPRAPTDTSIAREQLRAFVAAQAPIPADFLIDLGPGADHADFDVYLDHPEGGTVALSFRDDGARPWFIDYSQHWATNFVLHVGTLNVSIQQAMFALHYLGEERPDMLDTLVRDTLVANAVASVHDATLEATAEEIQAASEAFRRRHGLESAADTHAWLEHMGWSMHHFRHVLTSGIELRKMEEALVAENIAPHFAQFAAEYDVVRYFRVSCDSAEIAAEIADSPSLMVATQAIAAQANVIRAVLETARAHTLAAPLRSAAVGSVVGPVAEGTFHVVTQVIARTPATALDPATRAVVRERLLRDWVHERLRDVPVRWNWT